MKIKPLLFAIGALFFLNSISAQQTLLLRQPALSENHLAFVYAGDIWVANRDGTYPRRLTTSPVGESGPIFSPDGTMIAFSAAYENNFDVYVISVDGGQPKRLTWHPGYDISLDWSPDGSAVAVASGRETDHGRSAQLYHASLEGGLPEKQMEARIYRGTYDEGGRHFAYIPFGSGYNGIFGGSSGWKGYRGGTTPAIRIMDLEAQQVTTVPGAGATNLNPVWLDGQLYFLSDREDKVFNLFHYNPSNGSITQLTEEDTWDVRSASGYSSTLVFETAGRIKTLDLQSGDLSEIQISINPDLPQLRTEWKDAGKTIQYFDISPSGKRAILTARGEVFTVPVKDGSTRNITNTGTQREYTAIWSPKGDQLAYIVDSRDGQSLVIEEQRGMGEKTEYELGSYFYYLNEWSGGDTPRISFTDNHLGLYVIDVSDGEITKVGTGARRSPIESSFSPDGNWLIYTQEQPNLFRDLFLMNFETGVRTLVTDGTADIASPVFSPNGEYAYFAASTNSGPLQDGLNMSGMEMPYRAGLYAMVLKADGKSPLYPKSGDEEPKDEEEESDDTSEDEEKTTEEAETDDPPSESDESEEDEESSESEKEEEKLTEIDLEGLSSRIVALQVPERNYGNLAVSHEGNLLYIQGVQSGSSIEPPGRNSNEDNELVTYDFEEQETKSLFKGLRHFDLSADGKQLLIQKPDSSLVVAEVKDKLEPKNVGLGSVRVRVNPREEWTVIFDEVWRMEHEHFYDPNMHGLDWDAVYDRFRPLVDHVGRREDLNTLMVEMVAEMQVGHNRLGGGDAHLEKGTETGLLGANLVMNNGLYQLERVYTGESWNPFLKAPLAAPGNNAREGEYILSINGHPLTASENIWEYLQGTIGKQVILEVSSDENGEKAREIIVEPVGNERNLRLWHWVEKNRQAVLDATDGRVGYVYLPNTAGDGFTFFNRMFFAQLDKEAMIIDERSNGGGKVANYMTDILSRKHLSGWKDRDGDFPNSPAGAMHGPKVMLIDQDAGSGGDFLPYAFRYVGAGKLIGTRTWGGLIGISHNPALMDGGFLVVPFFRFFNPDQEWTIENEGVTPDIEVELDPILTNEGRDSQLEAAIAEVLSQLESFVPSVPAEAPPYPTELGK